MEHLTREQLEAGLDEIRRSPKEKGVLNLIVRRPETEKREVLDEGKLDITEVDLVILVRPHIKFLLCAALESFARAASGGTAFPITTAEMIHGAAVTETIVKSAQTGLPEKVS